MKLLYCHDCKDIRAIRIDKWITCKCGKVGGQYNIDGVSATIGGLEPYVLGIPNPYLDAAPFWRDWSIKERRDYRHKQYPESHGLDIWWGDYKGDQQLLFIEDSKGPRIRFGVVLGEHHEPIIDFDKDTVKLDVKDGRFFRIGDKFYDGYDVIASWSRVSRNVSDQSIFTSVWNLLRNVPRLIAFYRWRYGKDADGGSRFGRDAGEGTNTVRPKEDRTAGSEDVKESTPLAEERDTSGDSNSQSKYSVKQSGGTAMEEKADRTVVSEVHRKEATSNSRKTSIDDENLG